MSLWEMSISGAVMIVAIVAIRALAIHRLPKRTFLVLWNIALVRLLIPYTLPSTYSVYSLLGKRNMPLAMGTLGTGATAVQQPVTVIPTSGANTAAAMTVDTVSQAIDPWIAVWIVGMLVCTVFFAVTYWKCRREFRESLPVENGFVKSWLALHRIRRALEIRQTDRISTPLTYGVLRPVILLPTHTNWEDETALTYVLAHEYVHIRRFDAVVKLVLTAAACVHWFNPAVWIMYVLANRDIELSCDEAVVCLFGERTKSAYAMTLICMEETRSGLNPLCNNFNKNAIEERIVAIMKIKKTSWVTVLVALALIAGVTTAFATTGQTAAADPVETLVDSLRYADGAVSFQAPPNIEAGTIDVRIYGRAEYDDGFSASIHALDDVEILPGETYSAAYDPAYTEWGMEILYQEQSRTVDLLSLVEFEEVYPTLDIGWWTAEEYEAWLEQEKVDLQSIIGDKGWNPTEGWYTWTQEKVDETIALYEQILQKIKDGEMVSKIAYDESGDAIQMMSYDPQDIVSTAESDNIVSTGENQEEVDLSEFEPFGLTEEDGKLFYNRKLVRYFTDSVDMEGNIATRYQYWNGKLIGVKVIADE